MEVHGQLGPGFLESVYHTALAHELGLRNIPFERRRPLPVMCKGQLVGRYEADILVDQAIILELKAASAISAAHIAQAHHYLAATGLRLAIIMNFGAASLSQSVLLRNRAG
jgi:GxxExxY protein